MIKFTKTSIIVDFVYPEHAYINDETSFFQICDCFAVQRVRIDEDTGLQFSETVLFEQIAELVTLVTSAFRDIKYYQSPFAIPLFGFFYPGF